MPRYIFVFCLTLILGGCEAATGALASMSLQALSVAGQGIVRATEADLAAGQRHAGARAGYVGVHMQGCMERADKRAEGGDVTDLDAADEAERDCIDWFDTKGLPYTALGRIDKRIERRKGEKPALESTKATSTPVGADIAGPPP